jgi:metallophosphoesterase superfamily enzyme
MTASIAALIDQFDLGQSHIALAREIKNANTSLKISIRTLRQQIATYRGVAEELPEKLDFSHLPAPYTKGKKENVLVISDPHEPFTRKGYMLWCRTQQEKYKCGTVVCVGDFVDNHYSSYHDADPDGKSAGDELNKAIIRIQEWHYVFPKMKICIGNHDDIVRRQLYSNGISARWLKPMNEVFGTKGWDWSMEHEVHGVLYIHGTGTSGANAAYNRAVKRAQSVVMGHIHTEASVRWHVTKAIKVFGMMCACGVDDREYAMAYARNFPSKYIVACSVVLDKGTIPINLPMEL